jgi:integrase
VPQLGSNLVQRLALLDIEGWHTTLRNGRLSARSIGHAHRVLAKALGDAERAGMVVKNVCRVQKAPKVADDEMVIARDVPALVDKLDAFRLRVPALAALFTGLRLSEILALRWNRVDVDAKVIQVREALEQTKAHGIRFKRPKSKAGRRDITMPDILIEALREHRKRQLELRMQLPAGRLPDDALLFATVEGEPLSPNAQSPAWADFADSIGMPDVTFHPCGIHTRVN